MRLLASMTMQLVLIRHGHAHAGLHGTIAGPTGCRGLTGLGRSQAARLRDHLIEHPLGADVVLASRLPRAIETGRIVAPALGAMEIEQDCDLCEVHVGDADGTDWADYDERFGPLDMVAEPDRPFAPGGDSWSSFHRRVDGLMARLAAQWAGRTVVAFCHAGVIAATLRVRFSGDLVERARVQPENTGLTRWEHDAGTGRWTLRAYDETPHLVS